LLVVGWFNVFTLNRKANKMETKHTPTPWRVYTATYNKQKILGIGEASGPDQGNGIVAYNGTMWGEMAQAKTNAAFIVRACNSHHALVECQTMGASLNTPDFLDWVADRMVSVYRESPNVDFVLSLRDRAKSGREALAAAQVES
jgi:hypothetical protein